LLLTVALCATHLAKANSVVFYWAGHDSATDAWLTGTVTFATANYDPITGNCLTGGCELTIDIVNTAPAAVTGNNDELGGIYFNIKQGTTTSTGGTAPAPSRS
jgi:hypothetical protein